MGLELEIKWFTAKNKYWMLLQYFYEKECAYKEEIQI